MKLAVFGCSFSAGISINNNHNWVRDLAEIRQDDEIYNFALGGTSALWSVHLLKKYKNYFDKTIFQVTHPKRFTYWKHHDSLEYFYKVKPNLYEYTETVRDNVFSITPAIIHGHNQQYWKKYWNKNKNMVEFGKQIYKNLSEEQFTIEHELSTDYAFTHADLCFFHCKSDVDTRISSIEAELGFEFNKNLLDDSKHLNSNGCKLQAAWVNDYL